MLAPTPGLLFYSFLYRTDHFSQDELTAYLGPGALFTEKAQESDVAMKTYYASEMGEVPLKRFFFSELNPVPRESLVAKKLWAMKQEALFSQHQGKRTVNIDVGLITLENLLLATRKNFTHRVYLGQSVFADLTLIYLEGSFRPLPWSYKDYHTPERLEFFHWLRELLHLQHKG